MTAATPAAATDLRYERRASRSGPLSLRRRVALLFGAALVMGAVVVAAGVAAFLSLLDARRALVDDLDPARVAASEYFTGLVNQQTGVRGFVLSGDDLLTFSRVGRLIGDMADVDCDVALSRAVRNLETAREEAAASVVADPLPVVRGDLSLLTALFQNLLGNSIKYRGAEAAQVRINAERVDDHWEFAVADNGIGIDAEYAERVFVIFQRLHPKEEYSGRGIGLALCKKIVEFHGGRIWVDTDARPGTTVRWTLPVTEPPDAIGTEERDDEDRALGLRGPSHQDPAHRRRPR